MLNKDNCIPIIILKLKKIKIGEKIELRPYKRNRSVLIEKLENNYFRITENGFFQDVFEISSKELNRILKKILKREFPRSHKIRVYHLASDEFPPPFKKL
jgi:hypothetical protein